MTSLIETHFLNYWKYLQSWLTFTFKDFSMCKCSLVQRKCFQNILSKLVTYWRSYDSISKNNIVNFSENYSRASSRDHLITSICENTSPVNLVHITKRDKWQNILFSRKLEKFGLGVNLTSLFTNRVNKFLHSFSWEILFTNTYL